MGKLTYSRLSTYFLTPLCLASDEPLAENFNLIDGHVGIHVPDVEKTSHNFSLIRE